MKKDFQQKYLIHGNLANVIKVPLFSKFSVLKKNN